MEQTQIVQTQASNQERRVVVVGGGPTGTLMALYLAKMDWQVSVYERRRAEPESSGSRRSYNIVLNDRGLRALEQAGVELPSEKRVILQGNVRHTAKGATLSKGFTNSVSIDRYTLAQSLIQEGKHRFPQRIQYHFQQTLHQVNLKEKIALFQGEFGEHQQEFDLLIGADGVFSTVRNAMEAQIEGFQVQQNRDNMMFKICQLGPAKDLRGATETWADCFHTWGSVQPITLLAPPKADGSLNGVLILPQEGEVTYEQVQTEEAVALLFAEKFPDIFPELDQKGLPSGFAQDLLAQKAAYGGITTICSGFEGGDSVVLLGDAAHSVWPSLGQGCNVALESCRIFTETLAQAQGDLTVALPSYTAIRKPDTDAIARLSEIGFGGNKRAGNILFFTKILALMFLNKLFPMWFQKFALLQIGNPEVPYSQIWQQVQTQNRQLLIILILIGMICLFSLILNVVFQIDVEPKYWQQSIEEFLIN